jgi:hypothetical protein
MGLRYQYTTMDRVFAKLDRDLGADLSEGDIIEWTAEALEAMSCVKSYEEAIFFSEVKNHQFNLPKSIHAIIQIARNNRWSGPASTELCIQDSVKSCDPTFDFALFKFGCGVAMIPEFNTRVDYRTWKNSDCYQHYTPVRLTNNSFFNSLVCTEFDSPYTGNSDEYNIIMKSVIRLSFQEGQIAMAYLRQALDETTGYPFIPDSYSHLNAIVAYIRMKKFSRDCDNNREGACGKADRATGDWHWYCQQAKNIENMPHGEDEYQNLLDQRQYVLPRNNRYFGFFGNLSKPENRVF